MNAEEIKEIDEAIIIDEESVKEEPIIGYTPSNDSPLPEEGLEEFLAIKEEENTAYKNIEENAKKLDQSVKAITDMMSEGTSLLESTSSKLTTEYLDNIIANTKTLRDDLIAKRPEDPMIEQANETIKYFEKMKDDTFRKEEVYKQSNELSGAFYDFAINHAKHNHESIKLSISDKQLIKSCEKFCKMFKLQVAYLGANAAKAVEDNVYVALNNVVIRAKEYGLDKYLDYVLTDFDEHNKSKHKKHVYNMGRFLTKTMADAGYKFLVKMQKVDDRAPFLFLILSGTVTIREYDDVTKQYTQNVSVLTTKYEDCIAALLRIYFEDRIPDVGAELNGTDNGN